jgi:hypothetical protein
VSGRGSLAPSASELPRLLSGGVQQVRVVLRALALLQLTKGSSAPRISEIVPPTPQAIRNIGHRYQKEGLQSGSMELTWHRIGRTLTGHL